MELQKLSLNVNKKASTSIRRIILGLCILAGFIILAIVIAFTMKDNSDKVKLYTAEIDNNMSEKVSFINAVAAGASSGTAKTDYYAYVDTMVDLYDDVSAVYVCVKENGVIYKDGIMTYMSGGWVPNADFVVSDRIWYKGAIDCEGVYVSEPYVDEQTGNICITLAKTIYSNGRAIGVAGMDMYMDALVTYIEGSYKGGDYVFLVSGEGSILTHPNSDIALTANSSTNVEEAFNGKYKSVSEKPLSTKLIWDYKGGLKFVISNIADTTGWNVIAVISLNWIMICIVLIIVTTLALAVLLSMYAKKRLLSGINPMFEPLEELACNISRISEGELDYKFNIDEHSKEVNSLSAALNNTMIELSQYISKITQTVTAISEKNLAFDVDGEYKGDYEKIKVALIEIMDVLNESFNDINQRADAVLEYSKELSHTSEQVAESATVQSESVMSASREMRSLTENMEQIAQLILLKKMQIILTRALILAMKK